MENSLFLRNRFNAGETILEYKDDIRKRFGDRGNNIANLCSAGYFEIFLKPLYELSKEAFGNLYEDIIDKSMLAVFVHSRMKLDEIPREIQKKIDLSKKYGLKTVRIHGLSRGNVDTILKCLEKQKEYFEDFKEIEVVHKEKDIIIVELLQK